METWKPGNSPGMTTFSKQGNGNSMETVETQHRLVDVIIDFDLDFTPQLAFKIYIIQSRGSSSIYKWS